MFSQHVYDYLETAMDCGLSEQDFWNMTLAEVIRHVESRRRIEKQQAKEKACYDYILADLVGRSVSRLYSSSATYPSIDEAYPALFDAAEVDEQRQKKKDELSALRFRQFAQSFNTKYNEEVH